MKALVKHLRWNYLLQAQGNFKLATMGNKFIKISLLVGALKIKKWYKEYLVVRFIASLRVSSTGSQFWEFFSFFFNLLLATLGLYYCVQAFFHYGEWGLLSSCDVQASHCGGVSCYGAVGHAGFSSCSIWAHSGLQSTSSVVVMHGLSYPTACGSFPDQRWNWGPLHCRGILNHLTTREAPGSS